MSDRTCSVGGCGKKHCAKGLCNLHWRQQYRRSLATCKHPGCTRTGSGGSGYCATHYNRHRNGGDMDAPVKIYNPGQSCIEDGCERPCHARGYCTKHYSRHKQSAEECRRPGCTRTIEHGSLGWCEVHYKRHRRGTDMDIPVRLIDPSRPCSVEGCDKPYKSSGYCERHYKRWQTGRDVNAPDRSIHDECSYQTAHRRIWRAWGSASEHLCVDCGFEAKEWAYDGSDSAQLYGIQPNGSYCFYSRYPEFYMPLCSDCHSLRDRGSAARELRQYRKLRHEFDLTYDEMRQACKREASIKRLREAADLEESA
jgi:hypothetical protein